MQRLCIVLILAVLLTACGVTPSATPRVPTATRTLTNTRMIQPPVTPIPPTATRPAPTSTPIPPASTIPPPTSLPVRSAPILLATPTTQQAAPNPVIIGVRYVSADGDGLFIRSKPDPEAKMALWPDGTPVGLIEQSGDWCKVSTPDGYVGYMPTRYLAMVKPTAIPLPVRSAPTVVIVPNTPTRPIAAASPIPLTGCSAAGAMAICKDGTTSFSKTRQGTCSGHGGVSVWC
jgi:SH3-like domain-containing protein